jgi:hypothetical protein
MADPCAAIRKTTARLEEKVADLKGDMEGASGSVLHRLAGQLTLALNQLTRAQRDLNACEASAPPVETPPVVNPPVVAAPPAPVPSLPDPCLAIRITAGVLETTVTELRDAIVDATGPQLHTLSGQLNLALNRLAAAQQELSTCKRSSAGWAVLLCHWSDDSSEPRDRQFFEDLFTTSGAGSLNMTDYFTDCSHGNVTLAGTEVFGWFDLGFERSAYVGNEVPGPNELDRRSMMNRAKAVARDNQVDLSPFFGVVVCFNVQTDLFGGPIGACCDLLSFEPSVIGQEMGHVYGLDHSRRDGSTEDYTDQWDTMSTWGSTHRAPHPRWTAVGPGLNGPNMRSQRWLDERRVWRSSRAEAQTITLRPLHRRELPGFLGAELPGADSSHSLFIEFRDVDRWDAGIPEPTVLVHRFEGNHSYVMHDAAGHDSLTRGRVLQYGEMNALSSAFGRVEVLDIDAPNRSARVRLQHRAAMGVVPELPTSLVPGTASAELAAAPLVRNGDGGDVLRQVVRWIECELDRSTEMASPAPKQYAGKTA